MAKLAYHRPEEDKVRAALQRYCYDPVGIVLRLAWLEGLTRNEIHALTWDSVDFDAGLLRLPDREVPLEAETAAALAQWKKRCEVFSEYVAVSPRRRTHMSPQSISQLARIALDAVGQTDIALKDLRGDFIQRQLETHDWPYVLRISGLSVETYRETLTPAARRRTAPPAAEPEQPGGTDSEFLIWKIMQQSKNTPEGIALWLLHQLGLQLEQIVRLTWDNVDFDAGVLHMPDGDVAMTRGVARTLSEESARRGPDDDPHVILSPRARKPMDAKRLSIVLRTALIRGGIEDLSSVDIRRGAAREVESALILDFIAKHGMITTRQAAELLELPDGRARRRLKMLTEQGRLICVGTRYFSPEKTVEPEKHEELILWLIDDQGSIRCRDAAEFLNIPPRQAGRLLKRMADQRRIVLIEGTKRYERAE